MFDMKLAFKLIWQWYTDQDAMSINCRTEQWQWKGTWAMDPVIWRSLNQFPLSYSNYYLEVWRNNTLTRGVRRLEISMSKKDLFPSKKSYLLKNN